jgi:hypothetical protein
LLALLVVEGGEHSVSFCARDALTRARSPARVSVTKWRRRSAGSRSRATSPSASSVLSSVTRMLGLDLSEGDVLLVAGATGGVGSLAVQLAVKAGATVVAPAMPEDEEFLRALGVSETVPRDGDVAAAVKERFPDVVDALLDPRQLRARHLRRHDQGRRAHRLADRRGWRRPRPHHDHGRAHHRELRRLGTLLANDIARAHPGHVPARPGA